MRELVLRELVENVALVLVPVAPAQEPPAAALPVALNAGIVPGRDKLRTDTVGDGDKRFELDARVADYAGVRRLAAQVRLGERTADVLFKLALNDGSRARWQPSRGPCRA